MLLQDGLKQSSSTVSRLAFLAIHFGQQQLAASVA